MEPSPVQAKRRTGTNEQEASPNRSQQAVGAVRTNDAVAAGESVQRAILGRLPRPSTAQLASLQPAADPQHTPAAAAGASGSATIPRGATATAASLETKATAPARTARQAQSESAVKGRGDGLQASGVSSARRSRPTSSDLGGTQQRQHQGGGPGSKLKVEPPAKPAAGGSGHTQPRSEFHQTGRAEADLSGRAGKISKAETSQVLTSGQPPDNESGGGATPRPAPVSTSLRSPSLGEGESRRPPSTSPPRRRAAVASRSILTSQSRPASGSATVETAAGPSRGLSYGTGDSSSPRDRRPQSRVASQHTKQARRQGASPRSSDSPPRQRSPGSFLSGASRESGSLIESSLGTAPDSRVIKMYIDAGLMLSAKDARRPLPNLASFAETLAERYNARRPYSTIDTRPALRPEQGDVDGSKWSLTQGYITEGDDPLELDSSRWRLRILSPTFIVRPGSAWRKIVNEMWSFLTEHYFITGDDGCDTHIRISMTPSFSLLEVKRIAQAVLHFETASEALLPERNGNPSARSIWLHGTNFAPSSLTRAESIAYVEDNAKMDEMDLVMHRCEIEDDEEFSWSFAELKHKVKEIAFRKPPLTRKACECLGWAEFAMSFILASIRYISVERLQQIPPNVGGLRWFLSRYNAPGVVDSHLMGRIWRGIPLNAMLDPRICLADETCLEDEIPEEMEHCDDMIREDRRAREQLARNAREPYY